MDIAAPIRRLALSAAIAGAAIGVAPALASAAFDTYRNGPHVSAASFSGGQLHETLTFQEAGPFVAHILFNPPSHPKAGPPLRRLTVALGRHAAGEAHISIRLGALEPRRYAVVINPEHLVATTQKTPATWVYFTIRKNGELTGIKLITPGG
jgi:hypothetical protein